MQNRFIIYFFITLFIMPNTIMAAAMPQQAAPTNPDHQKTRDYWQGQRQTPDYQQVMRVIMSAAPVISERNDGQAPRQPRQATTDRQASPLSVPGTQYLPPAQLQTPHLPAAVDTMASRQEPLEKKREADIYATTKNTIEQGLIAEHTLLKAETESEQVTKKAFEELIALLFNPEYAVMLDHIIATTDKQITAMRTAYNKQNFFMRYWNGTKHLTKIKNDLRNIILPSVYKDPAERLSTAQETAGKRFIALLLDARLQETKQPEIQPSFFAKTFSALNSLKTSVQNFFRSTKVKVSATLAIVGAALYFSTKNSTAGKLLLAKFRTTLAKISN